MKENLPFQVLLTITRYRATRYNCLSVLALKWHYITFYTILRIVPYQHKKPSRNYHINAQAMYY